jgi:hypothetical protein
MAVKKIPFRFAQFAPDVSDFDSASIEELRSGLPMYGGYRAVMLSQVRSAVVDTGEIATGAHGHLLSDEFDIQHARVLTATQIGNWYDSDQTGLPEFYPPLINESTPNDATFIMDMDSSQNPDMETSAAFHAIFKLDDRVDPGIGPGHIMKVRYRGWADTGVLTMTARLYEGNPGAPVDGTTPWEDDSTSTPELADGIWLYMEQPMTEADMLAIGDYTDLYVHFTWKITSMGSAPDALVLKPDADIENFSAWTGEGDEDSDLWNHINSVTIPADTPDDNVYIQTNDITGGETTAFKFGLDNLLPRPIGYWYANASGDLPSLEYNVRAKVTDKDATTMTVKFKNRTTGEYQVPLSGDIEDHVFNDDDTWGTINKTLVFGHVTFDVDDVDIEVSFTHTGGSGTPQSALPVSDVSLDNWEDEGAGTTNIFNSIDDSSDSTYITHPETTGVETYKGTIDAMDDPESYNDGDVSITVRAESGSGFAEPKFKVKLYYSGGSFEKWFTTSRDKTDHVWSLTEAQASALDWGNPWTYEIIKTGTPTNRRIIIYEVQADAAGGAGKGFVSDVWMEVDGYQGVEVSWQDFEIPADNAEIIGDQQRIYVGSSTELWHADDNLWTNVTRAASDYGQGSLVPQAWDFCSWGGNVIATNYEDEVQYLDLENGATQFSDLLVDTSPNPPADEHYQVKAKYCTIIKNHLVLANIGDVEDFDVPTAFTDAHSYSVWWSTFNDPTHFKVGDYSNLSDLEHLRQTRGEITGIVGGEYGTIFKRDSIYRMSWVGGNLVFRFDVLAKGVGTAHPQSIVDRDGDIFFYGHNDFYVMPAGGKPQPIGIGRIQSMLVEYGWESRSVNRSEFDEQQKHDLRVVGTYDQFSGLIFWAIDNQISSSSWEYKTDILVYNPVENRWGYIRDTNLDVSGYGVGPIVATPNIPNDEPNVLNNLYLVCNDSTAGKDELKLVKMVGSFTNPMFLRTDTLSSGAIGSDEPSMSISAVRPLYSRLGSADFSSDSNGTVFDPDFSGTIYCSPDPLMIDDVVSADFSSDDMNENGWAQLSNIIHGEFWKFEVTIPGYNTATRQINAESYAGIIKSMLGMQLEIDDGGQR